LQDWWKNPIEEKLFVAVQRREMCLDRNHDGLLNGCARGWSVWCCGIRPCAAI